MENVFENFTYTVLKLNKLIHKIKLTEMHTYGLKTIHVMCIYYLYKSGGLTNSELTESTLEDKTAISRAVKCLKDKNLVYGGDDGYKSKIKLTDEGMAIAEFILEQSERAVNAASCNFTDEQREEFYKSLNSIAEKLQKYYNELNEEK